MVSTLYRAICAALGTLAALWLLTSAHGQPAEVKAITAGMTPYTSARYTQAIATTNNRPSILAIRRIRLDRRWAVSGGMESYEGWTSELFRSGPPAPPTIAYINVFNGSNDQPELGYIRKYADGTRFVDVIKTARGVFEVRQREKQAGVWYSSIEYENAAARPPGYRGLLVSCGFCHQQRNLGTANATGPGVGGYGVAMISGSDGVFSDPVPALENAE